jgi:hypothetical protein
MLFSYYYIEIFILLTVQLFLFIIWYRLINRIIIALPVFIASAIFMGYIEFFNFTYKRPNYDEQRVPLVYPYELVENEQGLYITSAKDFYHTPEVFFSTGKFHLRNNNLYFKHNNPNSNTYEINLITLEKKRISPQNLSYHSFAEMAREHETKRLWLLARLMLIEVLISLLLYYIVKKHLDQRSQWEISDIGMLD